MADENDEINLDSKLFWCRAVAFHRRWMDGRNEPGSSWNQTDAVCIATGKQNLDGALSSEIFLRHLLGGVLMTNTLVCICENRVVMLSGKSKLKLLNALIDHTPSDCGLVLDLVELPKKDISPALEAASEFLRASFSGKRIGSLVNEPLLGPFASIHWPKLFSSFEMVNCNPGVEALLMVNHRSELQALEKSSELSLKGMKRLVKTVEKIFENESKMSQKDLANKICSILKEPVKSLKLSDADWDNEEVAIPFPPSVESGGSSCVELGALCSDADITSDVIILQLGVQYSEIISAIGRTYFVNGTSGQKKAYKVLCGAHKVLCKELVPGAKLGIVYDKVVEFVKSKGEKFFEKLPRCLGSGSGSKLRYDTFEISSGNNSVIDEGMCFIVTTSFKDLQLAESDSNKKPTITNGRYSCVISDTVIVKENHPRVLTEAVSSSYDEVSYEMESENEDHDDDQKENGANIVQSSADLGRRTTRASTKNPEQLAREQEAANMEKKISQQQTSLMQKKARAAVRTENGTVDSDEENESRKESNEELLNVYPKGAKEYPKDMTRNQIYCDRDKEAVLVPIGGFHVPFHVSVVKTVTKMEEDNATLLRLNFYYPIGSGALNFARDVPPSMRVVMTQLPDMNYIKELTFRSRDPRNLNHQFRVIKEMQKRIRQRQRVKEDESDLVQQVDIQISQSSKRPPELAEVSMRPPIRKGKCVGRLQAHSNGFRFRTINRETFDIIYSNVKHFIFQECKKELNVLIHICLKNPLIVGRTKTHNIQFFTEVVEGSSALDGKRRSLHDPDEEEEERREQLLKKRLNRMFRQFCLDVISVVKDNNDTIGRDTDFDMPYRKLAFQGVPHKEMVWISPTVHALVNLTETPFFVVTLEDIEHVHFERVTNTTKTFDMVIILKQHMQPNNGEPQRITSIPIESMDIIRQWLHDLGNITFTSGTVSLAWKTVMLGVHQELENGIFWKLEGLENEKKYLGWNFLAIEDDEDDSNSDDEDDSSGFSISDDSSSSSSDEDDWDVDVEEESGSDAEEGSENEEGDDWDELERQAAADDKRKSYREGHESEEDGNRKKKHRAR